MKLNEAGEALIKRWEGLRLKKYHCIAGYPTIGWGHVISPCEDYKQITVEQAEQLFDRDIQVYVDGANRLTKGTNINENQFAAVVSLMYNNGIDCVANSTTGYLLRNGKFADAAARFPLWCKYYDKKQKKMLKSEGLLNRRKEEVLLFNTPVK